MDEAKILKFKLSALMKFSKLAQTIGNAGLRINKSCTKFMVACLKKELKECVKYDEGFLEDPQFMILVNKYLI